MYVIRDAVGPSIQGWADATRFKNRILRYWPKTTKSDGTVVFGKLVWWTEGQGVIKTENNLKLYKILNIDLDELESSEKKGVKELYFYLDQVLDYVVTGDDVKACIEQFSPQVYPNNPDPFNSDPNPDPITDLNPDPYKDGDVLDDEGNVIPPLWDQDGWITVRVQYTPINEKIVETTATDEWLISQVDNITSVDGFNKVTYPASLASRLTAMALLDTEGVLFERDFTVLQRSIEEIRSYNTLRKNTKVNARYLQNAVIELKFRRISDVEDGSVSGYINNLVSFVDSMASSVNTATIFTKLNVQTKDTSIGTQLAQMANYVQPAVTDDQYYVESNTTGGYYDVDPDVSIKETYLSGLKAKDFVKEFGKRLKSGYAEKEAKWWQKLLVVVIVIITIVVAVILAIPTSGGSIGFAQATIALAIGSLLLAGLSYYWAQAGDIGASRFAAGGAEILGMLATITGVGAGIQSAQNYLAKEMLVKAILVSAGTATTAIAAVGYKTGMLDVKTATILGIVGLGLGIGTALSTEISTFISSLDLEELVSTGVTKFLNQPTHVIMSEITNFLNVMLKTYTVLVNPPAEGLAEKQAQLDAQEKELDAINGEESEAIWNNYTDPYGNLFEVGDIFDKSYPAMTSGLNKRIMNKYYISGY